MKKVIFAIGVIFFAVLCSLTSVSAAETPDAYVFSVTIPTSLPVNMDADGNIVVATNAKIVNNSVGTVVVKEIAVIPTSGWSLTDADTKMYSQKVNDTIFSMSVGGVSVPTSGVVNFDNNAISVKGKGGSANLSYSLSMPARSSMTSGTIANAVVTVKWGDINYEEIMSNVPSTTDITYGQTLSNSIIEENDYGTWSWKTPDYTPQVTESSFLAVFVPNNNATYNSISMMLPVRVKKATPQVVTLPTPSGITYGQQLNGSTLTGGFVINPSSNSNVLGTWSFESKEIKPSVSDSNSTSYSVVFTPADNVNYNPAIASCKITVSKATPTISATDITKTYGDEDFVLSASCNNSDGVSFSYLSGNLSVAAINSEGTVSLKGAGNTILTITSDETANFNSATKEITLTVKEPEIIKVVPALSNIAATGLFYGQSLKDSAVSGVAKDPDSGLSVSGIWQFTDKELKPVVSDSNTAAFSITFVPTDTTKYDNAVSSCTIAISKTTPTLSLSSQAMPLGLKAEQIINSTQLTKGATNAFSSESVNGTWSSSSAGGALLATEEKVTILFTPVDTVNYLPVSKTIDVTVSNGYHLITESELTTYTLNNVSTLKYNGAYSKVLVPITHGGTAITSIYGMFSGTTTNGTKVTAVATYPNNQIENMSYAFSSIASTSLDLSNFYTGNAKYMNAMFNQSRVTTLDLSNFDTSNVVNMSNMLSSGYVTSINLSSFNTSGVTLMIQMFNGASSLTSLDLSNFNTENVTNMSKMFSNCKKLVSLNVSSFNTSRVTNMSNMFSGCSAATLDLSNFDTSSVTDMSSMFNACTSTSINVNSFNTSAVVNMNTMFYKTVATTLDISNFTFQSSVTLANFLSNRVAAKALTVLVPSTMTATTAAAKFGTYTNVTYSPKLLIMKGKLMPIETVSGSAIVVTGPSISVTNVATGSSISVDPNTEEKPNEKVDEKNIDVLNSEADKESLPFSSNLLSVSTSENDISSSAVTCESPDRFYDEALCLSDENASSGNIHFDDY